MPLRLCVAIVAALPAFAQSQLTIRVPVRVVSVPTLVFSRDGDFLPALEQKDFRIFDNSRPQKARLDPEILPVSLAIAVQVSHNVRSYVPFIARTGSVVDLLLAGATGESAVITYNDDVKVAKPFDTEEDAQAAFLKLKESGKHARMFDAGMRAIELLKDRRRLRSRVLLFIGQPMDDGSRAKLADLQREAERENVSIFAFTLPEVGKEFVSDTFSLQGLSSRTDRGGFQAGVDLKSLAPVIMRSSQAAAGADPFSTLASATGGTQLHIRRQHELEDAISMLGVELRSFYMLSYSPDSTEVGYHAIRVEVNVPGALAHARPGYWLKAN